MAEPHVSEPSGWRYVIGALIVPIGLILFFGLAHGWYNHNIGAIAATGVTDPEQIAFLKALDYDETCHTSLPEAQAFRADLVDAGICREFSFFNAAWWLSWATFGVSAAYLTLVGLLAWFAKSLGPALVRSYRWAWYFTAPAAVFKIFSETILLTFASFEITVLPTNTYFPKLIIIVLFLGLAGLWGSLRALRLRIPLETHEAFVTHLTRSDAPELWRAVDDAAIKVGTSPPDNILVGEGTSFYVTTFKVHHDNGAITGKTLMLSRPLMSQMTPDEVQAIIGHELGHFAGGDLLLTEELYPRHTRAGVMAQSLAESLLGISPLQFLAFLETRFRPLIQAQSRIREFAADAIGAKITSPTQQGNALIRVHVLGDAYEQRFRLADLANRSEPDVREGLLREALGQPLHAVAANHLFPDPAFWPRLFEKHTAHPMDSHPPLAARLDALGIEISSEQSAAWIQTAVPDDQTAAAIWLGEAAQKLEKTATALQDRLVAVSDNLALAEKLRTADLTTGEGRELLERYFPPIEWDVPNNRLFGGLFARSLLGVAFLVAGGIAVLSKAPLLGAVICAGSLIAVPFMVLFYVRNHAAKLRLTAEGLSYSTWSGPLLFSDVDKITWSNDNSTIRLTFHFKVPLVPKDKWLVQSRPVSSLQVPVHLVNDSIQVANVILAYYQRALT